MKTMKLVFLASLLFLGVSEKLLGQELILAPRIQYGLENYELKDSSEPLIVDGDGSENFVFDDISISNTYHFADLGLEVSYADFFVNLSVKTNLTEIEENDEVAQNVTSSDFGQIHDLNRTADRTSLNFSAAYRFVDNVKLFFGYQHTETSIDEKITPDLSRGISFSDRFDLVAEGSREFKISHSGPFFGGRTDIKVSTLGSYIIFESSVNFMFSRFNSKYDFRARQVNSSGDGFDDLGRRDGSEFLEQNTLAFNVGASWLVTAWSGTLFGNPQSSLDYLISVDASKYSFYDDDDDRRIATTEETVSAKAGLSLRF